MIHTQISITRLLIKRVKVLKNYFAENDCKRVIHKLRSLSGLWLSTRRCKKMYNFHKYSGNIHNNRWCTICDGFGKSEPHGLSYRRQYQQANGDKHITRQCKAKGGKGRTHRAGNLLSDVFRRRFSEFWYFHNSWSEYTQK